MRGAQGCLDSGMSSLFTVDGIARWYAHLNDSARFAEASANWVGSLLLVESHETSEGRAALVSIDRGRCTLARVATLNDANEAEFILRAGSDVWEGMVAGQLTPTAAAMAGSLHLDKGNLMALLPHARAAAELLAAAAG